MADTLIGLEFSPELNLARYLQSIRKYPILDVKEEYKLAKAYQASHDEKIAYQLIMPHLRLVVKVVSKYKGYGLPLSEMISEGNIGLMYAVAKFDPDKGYHFISYAVYWIRQSILRAINEKSRLIRLPLNKAMDLVDLERAVHQYYYKSGYTPDVNELAAILDKDPNDILHIMSMSTEHISLEGEYNYDGMKDRLIDTIEDKTSKNVEETAINKELMEELKTAIESLSDIEKQIINARYGIDQERKTLKEVGEMFSFTKERIRQIEKKALRKMHSQKYSSLKDFLK